MYVAQNENDPLCNGKARQISVDDWLGGWLYVDYLANLSSTWYSQLNSVSPHNKVYTTLHEVHVRMSATGPYQYLVKLLDSERTRILCYNSYATIIRRM